MRPPKPTERKRVEQLCRSVVELVANTVATRKWIIVSRGEMEGISALFNPRVIGLGYMRLRPVLGGKR